jgi:adenylylsulfate kinase
LFVSGTIAAGKTTIAEAAAGILTDAGIAHGLIDLDWLAQAEPAPPEDPFQNELAFENLAAVWPNYAARGIHRLVVARVVENRRWRERAEIALRGVSVTVVRLVASVPTRRARIERRELDPGWRDRFLARTVELDDILDRDDVAEYRVDNDGRSPRAVAAEMLEKVGWLSGAH